MIENFIHRVVQVESVQAVSQAGWCENFMELELDTNNYLMIQVGAGSMLFRSRVNGVNDQTSIPFDGTANRFWRIRHDQSANLIYFETSADNNVWRTRKTVMPGFSLTALRFHLLAGAWGTGNSSPGTAKYDNFKLLASSSASVSLTVPNFGFEAPVLGNGNFQYGPTGGSWTFANGGGISSTNSPFTGVPSAAPEGVQVAFIQATGTVSQSISGFQANANYVITFKAIQRTNCCNTTGQDIGLYIDNTPVGTFHPGNTAYVEYSTPAFTTTTGAHTVKFAGLNGAPTGETAFIDNVRINGSVRPGYGVQWLVTDQLGTPRMIFDESGSLANVKRHDYLPFGEELPAAIGLRTTGQGYSAGDGVRQKFTQQERDNETGLDYFGARYYSSAMGRFTSPDPLLSSGRSTRPQSWNRYSYVLNRPLSLIDPTGLDWGLSTWYDENEKQWITDYHYFTGQIGDWGGHTYKAVDFGGDATRTLSLSNGRTVTIANNPDVLGGAYMRDVTAHPQADQAPVLPPSWMDRVPVLGTGRQFLFDYTTHNFEGALGDFGKMSFELGSVAVGGAVAASSDAPVAAEEATTTLYRAVTQPELDNILENNTYQLAEGQTEGKYFFEKAEDAVDFGEKMFRMKPGEGPYTVTSAQVDRTVIQASTPIKAAGEGPGYFVPASKLPLGPVKVP